MRFGAFVVARGSDMDAGIFADKQRWFECTCMMVFHWKMEQMIMTSHSDVMRISHARRGREVYKESTTRPQGVLVQSIWVC